MKIGLVFVKRTCQEVRFLTLWLIYLVDYAHGRRLHRDEERQRRESIFDPQCIIDLVRVLHNLNPELALALNRIE